MTRNKSRNPEIHKSRVYGIKVFAAAVFGALAFILVSVYAVGVYSVMIFALFLVAAVQDAMTGKVNLLAFLPIGILLFIGGGFFEAAGMFWPIFMSMLCIWIMIRLLKMFGVLDGDKTYLGFGDVVGFPLALGLSWVFLPFFGPAVFAAGCAAEIPLFIKQKAIRFLPWLCPPLAAVFIVSVVTSLL